MCYDDNRRCYDITSCLGPERIYQELYVRCALVGSFVCAVLCTMRCALVCAFLCAVLCAFYVLCACARHQSCVRSCARFHSIRGNI